MAYLYYKILEHNIYKILAKNNVTINYNNKNL